jgi:hypothetical protein
MDHRNFAQRREVSHSGYVQILEFSSGFQTKSACLTGCWSSKSRDDTSWMNGLGVASKLPLMRSFSDPLSTTCTNSYKLPARIYRAPARTPLRELGSGLPEEQRHES